jgi:ABC-2 type transport system permease protein
MTAFVNHFAFEFRTGIRNRNLLLLNYLFPLGLYAFMGLLMTELNPFFTPTLIPAMIIVTMMATMILGLPDPLVSAREAGIYRSYKINGVPAGSILVIPALTTVLHTTIVSAIITITAPIFFGAPLPTYWPGFVLVYFISVFCFAGLGVLIGVISSSTRMTVLWSQLIFLPSMMLGGLMIPLSMLPDALGRIALLLPSTHSMNGFIEFGYGVTTEVLASASLFILFTGGILAFILALFLFSWDSQNSTRRAPLILAVLAMLPYLAGLILLG